MFDNINNLSLHSFRVQLDTIVKAICEISFDIGVQLKDITNEESSEVIFTIEDMFSDDFLLEISVRADSLSDQMEGESVIPGYTKDEFFTYIADYYSNQLTYVSRFLQGLDGSDVLLIDKNKNHFLSLGDKPKDRINKAIIGAKILNNLIEHLKSDKIRKSLEKIGKFENDIFYRGSFSTDKLPIQPILPFLPIKIIDFTLIELEAVDADNYYLNTKMYKKLGADITGIEEYKLCKLSANNSEIGLIVGEFLLVNTGIDLQLIVKQEQLAEYFWTLLLKSYTKPVPKPATAQTVKSELIQDFLKLRDDHKLSNLLSHLKHNFYLTNTELVTEEFEPFFNKVVSFDKLEHLDSYQFLMSSNFDEETALGVYTTAKVNSSYNLLHWINHKGAAEVSHFRKQVPNTLKKNLIAALKPSVCYYYLEKYFEDFVESILDEKKIRYISNSLFSSGDSKTEVDFLCFTGKKFIYIETKTKLSRHYIDDFLKFSSHMLSKFTPLTQKGIDVDFVLLGAYSDQNVEDYRYFVDATTEKNSEGYNQIREGMATKTYYFNIPIPDQHGKNILCIAEPHYDKLSILLEEICQ